ncbi:tRNA and rRNA cytosine-C5-methylase [Nonlabens tegetincola]|uniref:tRNA and rRNA cytosine-C5-methylase n=1 Tax=Nonlabens tegetincola TaxID=323273 RepID=A0A090QND0_9FLAO|nr:RsmB/NOP family class I SAM-dependent RNA methyltransferase [Nonlabens tegetincola]MEE2801731.1 RsmB/NOP family class I SAM-dependent RNA methyltransferase [Bacteroidota bacterium]GAK96976.1 tRNA and rRNA cytosine-C5-methylase [Nonlabens tegetincola]
MRFHHNLVVATTQALHNIFNDGKYADQAIQKILKKDTRWGSRDRAFIAETTYDIVRYKRLYSAIADVQEPFKPQDLWRLTSVWIILKGHDLPAWEEYYNTPVRRIKGRFDELRKKRVMRESIPNWMDELALNQLEESFWEKELHALNEQANVVLRVNELKTDINTLKEKLVAHDIATDISPEFPNALVLRERANVFSLPEFQDGLFEVQDAGSQKIAPFLQVEPGMRILDACAGAGGKTLHLAALTQNKGQIIATDIYSSKLKELKRRARRAGAHNIETRLIDTTKVIKKLHGKMDRILIDAPCSGLGVLRRNPDAKWKLEPQFLETIQNTQQEILQSYSKVLKSGGKLVYATCSILPSENQDQVKIFLESEIGKEFELEEEKSLFAHLDGFDGFYMARLSKK